MWKAISAECKNRDVWHFLCVFFVRVCSLHGKFISFAYFSRPYLHQNPPPLSPHTLSIATTSFVFESMLSLCCSLCDIIRVLHGLSYMNRKKKKEQQNASSNEKKKNRKRETMNQSSGAMWCVSFIMIAFHSAILFCSVLYMCVCAIVDGFRWKRFIRESSRTQCSKYNWEWCGWYEGGGGLLDVELAENDNIYLHFRIQHEITAIAPNTNAASIHQNADCMKKNEFRLHTLVVVY